MNTVDQLEKRINKINQLKGEKVAEITAEQVGNNLNSLLEDLKFGLPKKLKTGFFAKEITEDLTLEDIMEEFKEIIEELEVEEFDYSINITTEEVPKTVTSYVKVKRTMVPGKDGEKPTEVIQTLDIPEEIMTTIMVNMKVLKIQFFFI